MKKAPKEGVALVLGVPKEAPSPAGPAPHEDAELSALAEATFPGTRVDVAMLKELIHACMETEYE